MSLTMETPYVVGQWVRGVHFYGRTALLDEILDGPRESHWVLGNRRVGKTSLLKECERIALDSRAWVPIFWDLQGSETPDDLAWSLWDAVLDQRGELERLGIDLSEPRDEDVIATLRRLKREIVARDSRLLLLCDEAEALISIAWTEPKLVSSLGSILRSGGIRSVMASTIRLWSLADRLPGFVQELTPPSYVAGLDTRDAEDLVRQTKLDQTSRPSLEPDVVDAIVRRCGRHPYLLQLLARRTHLIGDLEKATHELIWDSMVSHFLTVDFEALSGGEQAILRILADGPSTEATIGRLNLLGDSSLDQCILRLERLGFIELADSAYRLSSVFFEHWLRASDVGTSDDRPRPTAQSQLQVGEWIVEPEGNLIVCGGRQVRLEPRVMNLLVFLSSNAGAVVSKDQIVDAVWAGAFISESALTRTVADLRKALGDDARSPRYLETISKRGYRLVAEVVEGARHAADPAPDRSSRFALVWNGRPHTIPTREFVIGRDSQCSLCIPSNDVSRRHARIVVTPNSVSIEDLGSRNGTWLNESRIDSPEPLSEGDVIRLGSETLVFRDESSPSVTQTDMGVGKGDAT